MWAPKRQIDCLWNLEHEYSQFYIVLLGPYSNLPFWWYGVKQPWCEAISLLSKYTYLRHPHCNFVDIHQHAHCTNPIWQLGPLTHSLSMVNVIAVIGTTIEANKRSIILNNTIPFILTSSITPTLILTGWFLRRKHCSIMMIHIVLAHVMEMEALSSYSIMSHFGLLV